MITFLYRNWEKMCKFCQVILIKNIFRTIFPLLPLLPLSISCPIMELSPTMSVFGGTLINLLIINYFLKINGLALVSCFPKIKASRRVESNITSPSRIMLPPYTLHTKAFSDITNSCSPQRNLRYVDNDSHDTKKQKAQSKYDNL